MEKNNFNPIGNRPLAPTIYDENITPLESMNKLAFKINKLIGDDTNVKEVVDKLLDVYASHMKLQGGYCNELKCIAFENPISCSTSKTSSPVYVPSLTVNLGVYAVKGDVTFYQWQYKNDNGVFVDLEADGSNSKDCKVPVTFYEDGETKEFRCKLQSATHTYYTESLDISFAIPKIGISQTYQNIGVNTYEKNKITWSRDNYKGTISNKEWLYSLDGTTWQSYPTYSDTITPYYYIDRGTKTNGISVGDGDVGTDKYIYWKFKFTVNNVVYYSNTLTTTVHIVDYDCGAATFNGTANNSWKNRNDMIQWCAYYSASTTDTLLTDLALSINKTLNNDIITSVQWLYKDSFNNPTSKPTPQTLLSGATDINKSLTFTINKSTYLTNNLLWFRLQVIVGNKAYYSDIVGVFVPTARVSIEQNPTSTLAIGSTVTLTGTLTNVPSELTVDDIKWFLSNNKTSWSEYSVYSGSTKYSIKVKIYNDNTEHLDGFGVNGGTGLYVKATVGSKIYGTRTVSIKQS